MPTNAQRLGADPHAPKLLDQVRSVIRAKHYSIRTEDAYIDWVRRFILHFGKRHPRELGSEEVEQFLSHLAVYRRVAASTQNQAKSALLFLYRDVLQIKLPWLDGITKAKVPQRLPVVLTRAELQSLFARLRPPYLLMAQVLYGSGLRLMECVRLRVKDLEFDRGMIIVRDGKGQKDRVTMLAHSVASPLRCQLRAVQSIHRADLAEGGGDVYLPFALSTKYPTAPREWGWQYVFPAARLSIDPRSGIRRRHHVDEQGLQRAFKQSVRDAGIVKPATPHTLRHYVPFLTMSCNDTTVLFYQ